MGIDACAKLLYGFPIDIGDNDELSEMIDNGDFPFIWKNPADYAEREIYIQLTEFHASDYTAECLGENISSAYKYGILEIGIFCKQYNIEQKPAAWYLIPYYW